MKLTKNQRENQSQDAVEKDEDRTRLRTHEDGGHRSLTRHTCAHTHTQTHTEAQNKGNRGNKMIKKKVNS